MRNKFLFLTKMSLLKKIKNKTFVIVNILLLIIMISLTNIDSIIKFFGGDFDKKNNIMIVDNTNSFYDKFKEKLDNYNYDTYKYSVKKYNTEEEAKSKIKKEEDILLVISNDKDNYISAKLITYSYINTSIYTSLENITNEVKKEMSLEQINISKDKMNKITQNIQLQREFIKVNKNDIKEKNKILLNVIFPILILPIFLLMVSVIQMIGAEINEEKSTRSMEIIITNISAKVHFFSKVLATNLFVLIQSILLFVYSFIGLLFRTNKFDINVINNFGNIDYNIDFSIFSKVFEVIPATIILLIITIFAYSLLAGILASVTTNMEDFNQIQVPIVILMLTSFYLSMASAIFNGSIFIRIISYMPFISSILSPCLYLTGVLGVKDVIISIVLMIGVIYLLIKYGLRIYKNGILNYSSNHLWKKIFKSLKN